MSEPEDLGEAVIRALGTKLPKEAQKELRDILMRIDDIMVDAFPDYIPTYTVIYDAEQDRFGLHSRITDYLEVIRSHSSELRPLYLEALTILKQHQVKELEVPRPHGRYKLTGIEVRTLEGLK